MKTKLKLSVFAAIGSILTFLLFHLPFWRHAISQIEPGFNGTLIIASLGIIMLAGNFLAIYLLMYLGRIVGKILVAFFYFIGNSIALYFINTYDVMIDDTMMGNVFNTKYSEAAGFWSWGALLYIVLMGVVPCILIFSTRVDYGRMKTFFRNTGIALGAIAVTAFGNMSNWTWMDKNSTVLGSLILPWSYVVNTFRYHNGVKARNHEEIPLPDASFKDDTKTAMVLVIGESARSDHFSLLGYDRPTNPLLSLRDDVSAFKAEASATYTIGGVKAILEHRSSGDLYEILPNYLSRAGADVSWRTSNWGEPPVHIEKYYKVDDLALMYPDADKNYDGILAEDLAGAVASGGRNKVLVILHTSTSHGPSYGSRYPSRFEVFTPVCNTVEMAKCPHDELINAYDNSIVYTDWLLNDIISRLETLEGWKTGMIFVSDHGESLGENNLYMHGVPMAIAPKEQLEIPFIVWTSDGKGIKDMKQFGQHNVFHSVLNFMGAESEAYDEEMNIFE